MINNKDRVAHYSNGSIAARMLSFNADEIDQSFWNKRISAAFNLRKNIGLVHSGDTNIFRLIHAEGDHLPGLIVDYYNGTAVVQCHSIGMHKSINNICEALRLCTDGLVKSIFNKKPRNLTKGVRPTGAKWLPFGEESAMMEGMEYGHHFL